MDIEQVYSYLGGLIDGDGSIMLSIHRRKGRVTGISVRPVIKIEMTHRKSEELFSVLAKEVGGYSRYEKGRGVWVYVLKGLKDLTRLEPHLFLKQEQARLLIQAINIMQEGYVAGKPTRKETLLELINLSYRIRQLNQTRSGAIAKLETLNRITEYVKTQYDKHLAEVEYRRKHHKVLHPEFGEHN